MASSPNRPQRGSLPASLGDAAARVRGTERRAGGSGYATVQDEGSALTQRAILDFAGAGVTATDDAANSRTLVTIPGGGSPWDTTITKAADESVTSSTAVQDDNELLFTPASGGVYRFEIAIGVHDGAGFGIGWDMGCDTTIRGAVARVTVSVGTAVFAATTVNFSAANTTNGPTGFTDYAVLLWGVFTAVTGTPTAFIFRWAQKTSGATAVTVKAGSTLSYRRIF